VSAADLELAEGETLVDDETELIYRQITKHMMDGRGQVATHAFTGQSGEGDPSYARSSAVTAQASRDWHTRYSRNPSLGVWGLTVAEVIEVERFVIDDTGVPLEPDERRAPGHCFIDLDGLDRVALKSLRAALWQAAMDREEIPTREPLQDGELELELSQ
jgi:hypothetical protein